MSLIASLPDTPLDIVGDIHGEIDALESLIHHLGYQNDGRHPENRKLVFVGDFIDRGPDSPQVLRRIQQWVANGNAFAILGNHEINLLANDAKDGSGWYFPQQYPIDQKRYRYQMMEETEKSALVDFLNTLPIALERKDLRIIHALWQPEKIQQLRLLEENITPQQAYFHFEKLRKEAIRLESWFEQYQQEHHYYHHHCRIETEPMPMMESIALRDLFCNDFNPLRSLTCGTENFAKKPFFAAGRWRMTTRTAWWNDYQETTPVIIGHYWRQWQPETPQTLFPEPPNAWLGAKKNVFCVDYSVGARWRIREKSLAHQPYRLAALRFPEQVLIFDDGEMVETI